MLLCRMKEGKDEERADAWKSLLNIVKIDPSEETAKKAILALCKEGLTSPHIETRMLARGRLSDAFVKADIGEAKQMLEKNHKQAMSDFDAQALQFLDLYSASNEIGMKASKVLASNLGRLARERQLDVLGYIAILSSCPIETKIRAAKLVARLERRKENLEVFSAGAEEPEIKRILDGALDRRGGRQERNDENEDVERLLKEYGIE